MSVIVLDLKAKDNVSPSMNRAKKSVDGFNKSLDKMQEKIDKMNRTQVKMMIEAYDRVSPVISQVMSDLRIMTTKAWKVTLSIDNRASGQIKKMVTGLKTSISVGVSGTQNRSTPTGRYAMPGNTEQNTAVRSVSGTNGSSNIINSRNIMESKPTMSTDLGITHPDYASIIVGSIMNPVQSAVKSAASDQFKAWATKGVPKASMMPSAGGATKASMPTSAGLNISFGSAMKGSAALMAADIGLQMGSQSIISGIGHLVKGWGKDDLEGKANTDIGMAKIGWTTAGAAIGSILLPGIGTMIGMGLGSAMGEAHSGKIAGDYEAMAESENYAAIAIEKTKYESRELKKALGDTSLSAEELQEKIQDALGENMKRHFGDVIYSLEEIQKMADKVVFGKNAKAMINFEVSNNRTEESRKTLEDTSYNKDRQMRKLNYGTKYGIKMDGKEQSEFVSDINGHLQTSSGYLEERYNKKTEAIKMTYDGKQEKKHLKQVDDMYIPKIKRIKKHQKEVERLLGKMEMNGGLNKADTKDLEKHMNIVDGITNREKKRGDRAADKGRKAEFGADKSPESFTELQKNFLERKRNDDQTRDQVKIDLIDAATEKYRKSGKTEKDLEVFKNEKAKAEQWHEQDTIKSGDRVVNKQLDDFTDAFFGKGERDEMKNQYQEKIMSGLAKGKEWTQEDIMNDFQIKKNFQSGEDQDNAYQIIENIINSLPDGYKKHKINDEEKTNYDNGQIDLNNKLQDGLDRSVEYAEKDLENYENANFIAKGFADIFGEGRTELEARVENRKKIADNARKSETGAIGIIPDTSGPAPGGAAYDFLKNYVGFWEDVGGVLDDVTDLIFNEPPHYLMTTPNKGTAGSETDTGNVEIAADDEELQANCEKNREKANEYMTNAFAPAFMVNSPVSIMADYSLANPSAMVTFSGGGKGTATVVGTIGDNKPTEEDSEGAGHKALGGFPSGKQLSWICEEGPEAIIPLTPQRRQRALALYERTGRLLGVNQIQKNARGGIIGINAVQSKEEVSEEEYLPTRKQGNNNSENESKPNIQINVDLGNNEFVIGSDSKDAESVMSYIRDHISEIANEAGSEIAFGLEEIFSNKPLTEGA